MQVGGVGMSVICGSVMLFAALGSVLSMFLMVSLCDLVLELNC